MQDPIPDWITHLALVSDGKVLTGTKDDILEKMALHKAKEEHGTAAPVKQREEQREPIVVLRNVTVSYGERKVRRPLPPTSDPPTLNLGYPIHQLDHPPGPTLASPRHKRYATRPPFSTLTPPHRLR